MTAKEIKEFMVEYYGRDIKELNKMSYDELEEEMSVCEEEDADMFPNDDEYDGSHEWD